MLAVMLYTAYRIEAGDARAFDRLVVLSDGYHYRAACSDAGKTVSSGAPNCVDLGRYVFVHGPVSRLYSKETGHGAVEIMAFGQGRASRLRRRLRGRSRGCVRGAVRQSGQRGVKPPYPASSCSSGS